MGVNVDVVLMGLRTTGRPSNISVEDMFAVALEQTGNRVMKHAVERMELEAHRIAKLAREWAPYDTGALESAIKVESDREGTNRRKRFFVYIDPSVTQTDPNTSEPKPVGQYAMYMHEGIRGFGMLSLDNWSDGYNLGERSKIKDAGRGVVGAKFLERAARERESALLASVYNAAREAL